MVGRVAPSSEDDPTVTESELISMIGYGEEEGTIEQGERQLIERAFAFSDLTVADVMTPRHKVFSYDGRRSVAEALGDLRSTPFSRIPLHEDDPDEVVRVLYVRELLTVVADGGTEVSLNSLGREPKFVPDAHSEGNNSIWRSWWTNMVRCREWSRLKISSRNWWGKSTMRVISGLTNLCS